MIVRDQHAAVAASAAVVVVLLVLVRTIAAGRGWFSNDDLGWQGLAASYPRPTGALLATPWNSHLQPVEWLLIWVFAHAAPLQFWPVVVSTALLVLAHGCASYLLLRRLFGSRPEIVPLVALATGSSLTLPASLWWAVQLAQLPLLVLSTLTTWAFLGYLRSGHRRDLLLTGGLYVGALLFSERALPLPVLLLLLQAGWFSGEGRLSTRLRHALRSSLRMWVVIGAVALTYAGWYVAVTPSATAPGASPRLFVDVAFEAVGHALAPALLGGPWTWRAIDDVASVADPGSPTRVLGVAVLSLLVVWSCATRRRAGRAWALLLLFFLVGTGLLTATRAPLIGGISGREYRYFTELALVAPLALGLAFLPVRWRARDAEPFVLERRTVPPAVAAVVAEWAPLAKALRRRRLMMAALVTTAFLVATTISVARYDTNWATSSARTWMTAAQDELEKHPEARVADTLAPPAVVPTIAGFYARVPVLLRPVAASRRFLTTGSAGDELRALDAQGRLKPVEVSGVASAPGPVPGCGWLVSGSPVVVPLGGGTFDGHWLVRMAYFTEHDRVARVIAGRTSAQVLLRAGLHVVFVVADGAIGTVTLSDPQGGGPVCVTEVQVGVPRAAAS